jgi:hypothetical protein
VNFNIDVTTLGNNTPAAGFGDYASTTKTLCNTAGTTASSKIPSAAAFIMTSTRAFDVISAFGLNGVPFYNSLDAYGRDAIQYEGSSFDDCLIHADGTGGLHHHIWSPCLRKGKGIWNNT